LETVILNINKFGNIINKNGEEKATTNVFESWTKA
jgi:hypothetical protein